MGSVAEKGRKDTLCGGSLLWGPSLCLLVTRLPVHEYTSLSKVAAARPHDSPFAAKYSRQPRINLFTIKYAHDIIFETARTTPCGTHWLCPHIHRRRPPSSRPPARRPDRRTGPPRRRLFAPSTHRWTPTDRTQAVPFCRSRQPSRKWSATSSASASARASRPHGRVGAKATVPVS